MGTKGEVNWGKSIYSDDILIIYDKSWGNIQFYSHFIATKLTSDIEPFRLFFVLYEDDGLKLYICPS